MRIGVVVGICVERDAISAAACDQAEVVAGLPAVDSVTLFTSHLHRDVKVPTCVVRDAWELARHPAAAACDLLIFHWGIYAELFDVVWLLPARQRVVVHFHNVTPATLVGEPVRPLAEASLRQLHALLTGDRRYWTHSDFNQAELVQLGVDPAQISDVPILIEAPPGLRDRRSIERVSLLCVGRLVPAKAPHVLVEAMELLHRAEPSRFRLTLAGNRSLSDDAYAKQLDRLVRRSPVARSISVVQPDDEGLWSLYEQADVLVSPSLHEGLCVPVIEGYLAGCHAVGTTEGNLPFVVQPPDPVVPPGDPIALADALLTVSRTLRNPSPEWGGRVNALCQRYSRPSVTAALQRALSAV